MLGNGAETWGMWINRWEYQETWRKSERQNVVRMWISNNSSLQINDWTKYIQEEEKSEYVVKIGASYDHNGLEDILIFLRKIFRQFLFLQFFIKDKKLMLC